MKVVIMGCGRVGARVATLLDEQGHHVTIIDRLSSAFSRLPKEYKGNTIIGTGIDEDVLRLAGIESTDVFVATTNADNRNIMGAQVAKTIFNVPHAVVRIYDPVRAEAYRNMNLLTVCPTTTMSALILDQIEEATTTKSGF